MKLHESWGNGGWLKIYGGDFDELFADLVVSGDTDAVTNNYGGKVS